MSDCRWRRRSVPWFLLALSSVLLQLAASTTPWKSPTSNHARLKWRYGVPRHGSSSRSVAAAAAANFPLNKDSRQLNSILSLLPRQTGQHDRTVVNACRHSANVSKEGNQIIREDVLQVGPNRSAAGRAEPLDPIAALSRLIVILDAAKNDLLAFDGVEFSNLVSDLQQHTPLLKRVVLEVGRALARKYGDSDLQIVAGSETVAASIGLDHHATEQPESADTKVFYDYLQHEYRLYFSLSRGVWISDL